MIISHRHRFIFFAVPRTGTHSLRAALRPQLGSEDWEQQQLTGRQTLPLPGIAALGHGHVSYRQLGAELPAGMLERYFKFAFVRNPYERFVSACFFLNRGDPAFAGRANAFMKQALQRERFRRRVLILPQHLLLADETGAPAMDYIGRCETLQASWDEICRRLGLRASAVERSNASGHAHWRRYYDGPLAAAVRALYQEDFRLFGYDPELI